MSLLVTLVLTLTFFPALNESYAKDHGISDFYLYANQAWLDSTILPEHVPVVNNWGILWDEITDKSIKILSGDSLYDLDQDHSKTLLQLQNFYTSTSMYSDNPTKRVRVVQKHFPMLLGVVFSKITLPQHEEAKLRETIKYLSAAYRLKINESNKLGGYHRDLYLGKLEQMQFDLGAPEISTFPEIPSLCVSNYEENIRLAQVYQDKVADLKSGWRSPPFETDCYYQIQLNRVKIHAGVLYDSRLFEAQEPAYLYATIGRTIAHEMTHAFDNVGRNYDEDGDHINWIEKLFSGAFRSKNEWKKTYTALIKQYSQYSIQDSLFVNGATTLQENIADLGGIEVSLLAFHLYLQDYHPDFSEDEIADQVRQYFINYAHFWREKGTEAFERSTLTRIHTPQKFRAIGPPYNHDQFYEVFEIDHNSKYYIPEQLRVHIW